MPTIFMRVRVSRRLEPNNACSAQGVAQNGRRVLIMRSMLGFYAIFIGSASPDFEDGS
jgi:hypothetical protein